MQITFRDLPVLDNAGATRNFELLQALLNPVWIAPVLEHSWVNFAEGRVAAKYMRDLEGFTTIEGLVKLGELGKSVFTLPVGYRPSGELLFATTAGGEFSQIGVNENGTVVAAAIGKNTYFSLNCRFRAER